jgi:hypothetical protein
MTATLPVDVTRFAPQIESALAYGDRSHDLADVVAMVAAGSLQAWPGPASILITEVIDRPRDRVLHFFLAAGTLSEIRAMLPHVLEWGKSRGCTKATLAGRRGWSRSFLSRDGWSVRDALIMERSL